MNTYSPADEIRELKAAVSRLLGELSARDANIRILEQSVEYEASEVAKLEDELSALRSALTRIEQEMRASSPKLRRVHEWADILASLVNEHEAPESSPKPSLGDF